MSAQLWAFDNFQYLFSIEPFSEAGRRGFRCSFAIFENYRPVISSPGATLWRTREHLKIQGVTTCTLCACGHTTCTPWWHTQKSSTRFEISLKVNFIDNQRQKDTQNLHERWQRNKLQTKVDWNKFDRGNDVLIEQWHTIHGTQYMNWNLELWHH